jgi:hypothetical protein
MALSALECSFQSPAILRSLKVRGAALNSAPSAPPLGDDELIPIVDGKYRKAIARSLADLERESAIQ